MTITEDDVRRIASLARLRLTPAEISRYRDDLQRVLEYVEKLRELDDTILPDDAGKRDAAELREDQVAPSLEQRDALRNAPDVDGNLFRVPRAIE